MRASEYPPPGYAGYAWVANGRLFLALPGKGTFMFEDSPDGLNELRVALLACAPQRAPVGPASVSGSNLASTPARRDAKGRPKLDEADLWGVQEAAEAGEALR